MVNCVLSSTSVLGQLTALQELQTQLDQAPGRPPPGAPTCHKSASTIVGHVRTLTRLCSLTVELPDACVEHPTPGDLWHALDALPHLTALSLAPLNLSAETADCWAGLTRLQQLQLDYRGEEPVAAISSMPCQLQSLTLVGESSMAELLRHLSQLSQLQHLEVSLTGYDDLDLPAPEQYAALTANSQLTCLHVYNYYAPPGAWWHLFPAGAVFDNLIRCGVGLIPVEDDLEAQIQQLVQSCPALQQLTLWIGDTTPGSFSVQGLQQLPRLTSLNLQCSEFDPDHAPAQGLAQLTQLRELRIMRTAWWIPSPHFSIDRVLQLTSLTALTRLEARCVQLPYLNALPTLPTIRYTSVDFTNMVSNVLCPCNTSPVIMNTTVIKRHVHSSCSPTVVCSPTFDGLRLS